MRISRLIVSVLLMVLALGSQAGAVNVDIYSGHSLTGGGAPYSGLVGAFTSPDVMFATDTGYDWHPFGQNAFGADINGLLNVGSVGSYSFTLNSDDGSLLFIDGSIVIDNGGGHGPLTVSNSAVLTAGVHNFEIQFFEDFGGVSGVDLYLPARVSYYSAAVPEPSSILLLSLAMAGLACSRKKFQKQKR